MTIQKHKNKIILIDVCHTPQFNFYKTLINRLASEKHFIYLTVLDRGKLLSIVRHELEGIPNIHIKKIGRHRMSRTSVIFETNLFRIFRMLIWGLFKKIDITFGNGYMPHIIGWLKGVPRYAFDDDPQTFDYKPKLWLCTESNYCLYKLPASMHLSPKAHVLPVLKEWSYLNPRTFLPNINALQPYNLTPHSYIFVREVTVGTINYTGQAPDSILQIANLFPKDVKVVLSLEKKDKKDQYPSDWILLQEPIEDIHSLIYYSCGLISSGDSMAREAALLGVPAYYLGIRYDMPANLAASEVANLQNRETMDVNIWLNKIVAEKDQIEEYQQSVRQQIDSKFIDINEYMYSLVKQLDK